MKEYHFGMNYPIKTSEHQTCVKIKQKTPQKHNIKIKRKTKQDSMKQKNKAKQYKTK